MKLSLESHHQLMYPLVSDTTGTADLHCEVVGEFESGGNFYWNQVIESGIVMTVFLDGRGTRIVNGVRTRNVRNDVAFARKGDRIEYYDDPGSPWRYIWVKLKGDACHWLWNELRIPQPEQKKSLRQGHELISLLKAALQKVKRGTQHELYSISLAWSLVETVADMNRGTASEATVSEQKLAESCRVIVENHLENCPTVADLASQFRVSRVSVFRAFQNTYGQSPKEYIEQLRFSRARNLLQQEHLSIKEIAYLCGFRDQCYFSYRFKKRFGLAPGTFRRQ